GSEKNEKNEAKWQDWMNKNNKYPFSKMLDKNSVKDCESKLGLESLSPEKMAEVQVHCSEKAGSQIITDTTWKQTKPAADTALKKSAHDTKIAKDPSISIHASNTPNPEPEVKENKDRPFATIASRR
ncbi:MAG TPA: hypothetical protein VLH77_02605, partial [Gammaproteobacteria bacterium]|nr:hypothetical protein [Gammaproteobacteria bacterium]